MYMYKYTYIHMYSIRKECRVIHQLCLAHRINMLGDMLLHALAVYIVNWVVNLAILDICLWSIQGHEREKS